MPSNPPPPVIPAHAGTHDVTDPERRKSWVLAVAGMTLGGTA